MKPRWSECHPKTQDMLAKAKELEERIGKAVECPSCKMEKAEGCCEKNSKDAVGKYGMQKAQPYDNAPVEGSQVGPSHLEIETGGRIAHRPQYWTNQQTIQVDDITNKGAIAPVADPSKMMQAPPQNYGPGGSTLYAHEVGGEGAVDLKKSQDVVLGSLQDGHSLRLRELTEATEELARRLS